MVYFGPNSIGFSFSYVFWLCTWELLQITITEPSPLLYTYFHAFNLPWTPSLHMNGFLAWRWTHHVVSRALVGHASRDKFIFFLVSSNFYCLMLLSLLDLSFLPIDFLFYVLFFWFNFVCFILNLPCVLYVFYCVMIICFLNFIECLLFLFDGFVLVLSHFGFQIQMLCLEVMFSHYMS